MAMIQRAGEYGVLLTIWFRIGNVATITMVRYPTHLARGLTSRLSTLECKCINRAQPLGNPWLYILYKRGVRLSYIHRRSQSIALGFKYELKLNIRTLLMQSMTQINPSFSQSLLCPQGLSNFVHARVLFLFDQSFFFSVFFSTRAFV